MERNHCKSKGQQMMIYLTKDVPVYLYALGDGEYYDILITSAYSCNAGTAENVLYGDVNQDRMVSLMDIAVLSEYLLKGQKCDGFSEAAADVTHDGKVDGSDYRKIYDYLNKKVYSLD